MRSIYFSFFEHVFYSDLTVATNEAPNARRPVLSPRYLIKDSLTAYISYTVGMNAAIKQYITPEPPICPMVIDFWIIPNRTVDVDDEHKEIDNDIGNISVLLRQNKLKHFTVKTCSPNDVRRFAKQIDDSLNERQIRDNMKLLRLQRVLFIVDRRYKRVDRLYCILPPVEYGDLASSWFDVLNLSQWYCSSNFLLPGTGDDAIGCMHSLKGYMFNLSYLMFKYRADAEEEEEEEDDDEQYIEDEDDEQKQTMTVPEALPQSETDHVNGHDKVGAVSHSDPHSDSNGNTGTGLTTKGAGGKTVDDAVRAQMKIQNEMQKNRAQLNETQNGSNFMLEIVAETTLNATQLQTLDNPNDEQLDVDPDDEINGIDITMDDDDDRKYEDLIDGDELDGPGDLDVAEHSAIQWSTANVKIIWSAQGITTRFTADQIYKVWPRYFVKQNQALLGPNTKIKEITASLFKLNLYDPYYDEMVKLIEDETNALTLNHAMLPVNRPEAAMEWLSECLEWTKVCDQLETGKKQSSANKQRRLLQRLMSEDRVTYRSEHIECLVDDVPIWVESKGHFRPSLSYLVFDSLLF